MSVWDLLDSNLLSADCVEEMAGLPPASVDSIVCDPPYGLGFMGKAWDKPGSAARAYKDAEKLKANPYSRSRAEYGGASYLAGDHAAAMREFQAWSFAWAAEAFRVLKPGGHLLAFGGTRTYHRLASAVEDVGFEIRDSILWLYGQGFPKSMNAATAIDRTLGVEPEVVGEKVTGNARTEEGWKGGQTVVPDTVPVSDEAKEWDGWGTALKPAHEPVVVARKPLDTTVARSLMEHGTGALNLDGCRVEGAKGNGVWGSSNQSAPSREDGRRTFNASPGDEDYRSAEHELGRWPANVALSHAEGCDEDGCDEGCPVAELDSQSGEQRGGAYPGKRTSAKFGDRVFGAWEAQVTEERRMDGGGASRFFFVGKATKAERNAGLGDHFEEKRPDERDEVGAGHFHEKGIQPQKNAHPTVKPVDLMRWLCRLVTRPGGIVLDPFAGSGTTGIAAHLEGFDFIGIERDPEYVEIARARLAYWSQFEVGTPTADCLRTANAERARAEAGQMGLLG